MASPPSSRNRNIAPAIKSKLLEEIRAHPAQGKLPTEREFAAKYGVNRLTVNKVMSELQREGYVERRPGKGTFVANADPRVLVGQQKTKRKKTVVIAYPDYFAYSIWRRVKTIEDRAVKSGLGLVNFKITEDTKLDALVPLVKQQAAPRGLVIIPPGSRIDPKSAATLDGLGIPVVLLAYGSPAVPCTNTYCVYHDYSASGYLAMDYLIRAGHRKIGYVSNEPWVHGGRLQYEGVKKALRAHGLRLKDLARSPQGIPVWDNPMKAAYRFTKQLLAKHEVSALMYRSAPGAVAGLWAIHEAGLRVPQDVSVISEGEGHDAESFTTPPLTTVVSDYDAIATTALDIIADHGKGDTDRSRQNIINVRVLERQSVRRIKATAAR